MKRLTKQQIKEIKESKLGLRATAKKFNVNPNTIKYYQSEEFRNYLRKYQRKRYGAMTKEQKKEYFEKKKEFQREYRNKRYNEDKDFKEKQQESSRNYQRKKYSIGKENNELKGGIKNERRKNKKEV